MRVVVDRELCQGHGVCTGEAPEVFRLAERPGDYAQVELILEEPPERLRAQVEAAVRYCPNRALRLALAPATPARRDGSAGACGTGSDPPPRAR